MLILDYYRIKFIPFSDTVDIRTGFNNLRIKPGQEKYFAFNTPLGMFEPTAMQMGSATAPAHFQRFANEIFSPLINRPKSGVFVYLDDIIAYSETEEQHWVYFTGNW